MALLCEHQIKRGRLYGGVRLERRSHGLSLPLRLHNSCRCSYCGIN